MTIQIRQIGPVKRIRSEVEAFAQKVYKWARQNNVTDEMRKANARKVVLMFWHDWKKANIPKNYQPILHSIARSADQQIQAFADGWKAASRSQHVLGKAIDVHIKKDGRRLRGAEMKRFFNNYIKGKILNFQLLYNWGFHTHERGMKNAIINVVKKTAPFSIPIIGIGILALMLLKKKK